MGKVAYYDINTFFFDLQGMSSRMQSACGYLTMHVGLIDQLPCIRSGELEKLDPIVEDGEHDDDDDIAKTITNAALKYKKNLN